MRRLLCLILSCISIASCLCIGASATERDSSISITATTSPARASSPYKVTVSAQKLSKADTPLFLSAGETVTIFATYSPKTASMDFGLIDSEGYFHYVTVTSGSISTALRVPANGNYYFAIRNNSNSAVDVNGSIKY